MQTIFCLPIKRKQLFLSTHWRTPRRGQCRRPAEIQWLKLVPWALKCRWVPAIRGSKAKHWWKSEASHFCSRGWLQACGMAFQEDSKGLVWFFPLSWIQFKQSKSHPVSVFLAVGLPLFIKSGQIQLAYGLPRNLLNLCRFEKLNSPCQYLISPEADKISWRYSMGCFSLQPWLLIPASSKEAQWPDLIFLHEIGWQLQGLESVLGPCGQAPVLVTGRPDPPYQGWPTKAAGPGD